MTQVRGRVSRLKDGRVGRFGWKAQTATLDDFVRSAAAGELGLEIPGRHQAADPRLPGLAATGLDMNERRVRGADRIRRSLRAPAAVEPADARDPASSKAGEATFKSIGCAGCHTPKLGDVDGIYSDLFCTTWAFNSRTPMLIQFSSANYRRRRLPAAGRVRTDTGRASDREWRTPPLWGIRDSVLICTMDEPPRSPRRSCCTAARVTEAARRYAELFPAQATSRGVSFVACRSFFQLMTGFWSGSSDRSSWLMDSVRGAKAGPCCALTNAP